MNVTFAMQDVVKSQKTSGGKGTEKNLKITNELKIITTLEDIYKL